MGEVEVGEVGGEVGGKGREDHGEVGLTLALVSRLFVFIHFHFLLCFNF